MLTALGQDSDRKKAESMGVDDYLVKSEVVLNDIIEHIKRMLAS
jgi:DNA-binding response OmpR family regulator